MVLLGCGCGRARRRRAGDARGQRCFAPGLGRAKGGGAAPRAL